MLVHVFMFFILLLYFFVLHTSQVGIMTHADY